MRVFRRVLPLLAASACVAPPAAPPPAPPPPRPAPPPPVVSEDWRDIPLTPGSWVYQGDAAGSSALFGSPGMEADLILRCDAASRTIAISRAGVATGTTLGFTTSAGGQSYQAVPTTAAAGGTPRLTANTHGSDPFLDKIAFSRGRFLVIAPGLPRLVLPAWPEVARTIEDCRK